MPTTDSSYPPEGGREGRNSLRCLLDVGVGGAAASVAVKQETKDKMNLREENGT